MKDFYPRPPGGGRQGEQGVQGVQREFLSTPSLRRATDLEPSSTRKLTFLSTLSLRRATIVLAVLLMYNSYFYPRSPYGERLPICPPRGIVLRISIHALLTESDSKSAQNSGALLRI